jgi:membrane-associated phospholipid phosphatase
MTAQARSGFVWTIVLVVFFAAMTVLGFALLDQPVLEGVRDGAARHLRGIARFLSRYGDFPWLLGGGLVALALCLRFRRRDWARILTAMLLSGVLAGLASNVIKLGAGRVRPRVENVEHGWYGPTHEGKWVSLRHDFQAFTSSHSACAFGFFFPLFLSRRRVGTLGLLVAAAIAWSRVQLNAHHISDIAAGAILGILAGWIVWRWIVELGGLSKWLGKAGG